MNAIKKNNWCAEAKFYAKANPPSTQFTSSHILSSLQYVLWYCRWRYKKIITVCTLVDDRLLQSYHSLSTSDKGVAGMEEKEKKLPHLHLNVKKVVCNTLIKGLSAYLFWPPIWKDIHFAMNLLGHILFAMTSHSPGSYSLAGCNDHDTASKASTLWLFAPQLHQIFLRSVRKHHCHMTTAEGTTVL